MIVSFEQRELARLCLTVERADAIIGPLHAQALIIAIADIEALKTAAEAQLFFGSNFTIRSDDSLSLKIGTDYEATFVAVGSRVQTAPGGRICWQSVTRVKMINLERIA